MTKIIKDTNDFDGFKCDKIVCVVTHKRQDFIDKWLRAWNNANKFGCAIAVFHAIDEENSTAEQEKQNILNHLPDFYVPFKNSHLKDLAAIRFACQQMLEAVDWKYLFWFTDDMLPMRKEFLSPFLEKINEPEVGLVAQCYEPKTPNREGGHIRTVAYAIKSDVAKKLDFPNNRFTFEHGDNNLLEQVKNMGYNFKLTHSIPDSPNYLHWTSFLDWMWDCHLLGDWKQYWEVYEEQFNCIEKYKIESNSHTLLSECECEKITKITNKTTAIIPTFNCSINTFMRCIFSLLLRSDPEVLHHFIVGINGGYNRDKDNPPDLQDKKQNFLEELRNLNWRDVKNSWSIPMPITITRTWSRLGHSQMVEQCIAWVHTEYYLLMHDDILILNSNWTEEAKSFFNNKNAIVKIAAPMLCCWEMQKDGMYLKMPHITSTDFILCNLPLMKKINADWTGYHVPFKFKIDNLTSSSRFLDYWRDKKLLFNKKNPLHKNNYDPDTEFGFISLDIGSFLLPKILNSDYEVEKFTRGTIKHFGKGSWVFQDVNTRKKEALSLELELTNYPEYRALYDKYKDSEPFSHQVYNNHRIL